MATWRYAEKQFKSKAYGSEDGKSKDTVATGVEAEDMRH